MGRLRQRRHGDCATPHASTRFSHRVLRPQRAHRPTSCDDPPPAGGCCLPGPRRNPRTFNRSTQSVCNRSRQGHEVCSACRWSSRTLHIGTADQLTAASGRDRAGASMILKGQRHSNSASNSLHTLDPLHDAQSGLKSAMGFSSAERSIALYDRMAPRPLPTFTRMSCAVDGCKKRGIHKVPVRKQTDIYFCADHREEGIRAKTAWNRKRYGSQ
jgi:hypothetical protein